MARSIGAAVAALGCAQIVGWGTTHYLPAVFTGSIAEGLSASPTLVLGAFSWGLLVAGLSARASGRLMDRHGGRRVMTIASLLAAAGLLALSVAEGAPMLFAGWTLIGLAMRSILYDGAFATLSVLAGDGARRAISLVTLFGGFASTVFWPIGAWLDASFGWRTALQVYAALNVLPCALLHVRFAGPPAAAVRPRAGAPQPMPLPGEERAPQAGAAAIEPTRARSGLPLSSDARRGAMRLAASAFTLHAFVQSAMSAHLMMLLGAFGFGAAVVVSAASLMGVAQVAARVAEMSVQGRLSAVAVAVPSVAFLPVAFAAVLLLPATPWVAASFVLLYGCANGLLTIVRGSLPLAVFGHEGYGEVLGRIAGPGLVAAAAAPVAFSALVEAAGERAGLWLLAACATGAFASIGALARIAHRAAQAPGEFRRRTIRRSRRSP